MKEEKRDYEKQLAEYTIQLKRALSKSNSMDTFDKEKVKDLQNKIEFTKVAIEHITTLIEEKDMPSF